MKLGLVAVSLASAMWAGAAPKKIGNPIIGNAKAPQGGTFYYVLNAEPEKLNPLTSTDNYASHVHQFVIDGLMTTNIETYEMDPALATSYEEDPKGLWYIFHLRKDAKWHDGKPVTAEDVKFSFDAIANPDLKFDTAHIRPYFENIEKAEVIDTHTVKFIIKKKYFNNFKVLASGGFMAIVPKHVYGDASKKNTKVLVGSGPYMVDRYDKGKGLVLKRNPNWWGNSDPIYSGHFKWEKIQFRFVKEEMAQLARLEKGEIDFLSEMTPEAYMQKTNHEPWGKTALKKKVDHKGPRPYGFVGWNFKNPIFAEKDVRIALAHLMNRKLMIEKFRFGMSMEATGPWYQQSPYANKKVKPISFNPKKALSLLKAAGWDDKDKDGVLEKGDQKFKFTLMMASKDAEKYMTIYKEDLKKAGIDMEIKIVEWNTFVKALDDKKFDAVMLGWGGGSVDNDPKQIWHSSSAQAGGSNFISYANPTVDKLIDEGRQELDRNKRIQIYQKIYKEIADDAPYAFLFNNKYFLYAHTSKMKMDKPTYSYGVGYETWWIKQD
ncbi:MAG: peptide ABC transporter substrate-binding protein [Bdellovibrionaceae bacterium]|nr:peptide ABC transporter substrate-binding protein [Bdellovibrionales bacterium]MCB9086332.1 peptide ABC transporter substrate-binding protein [Pseudobdellovibrionaceae bacterium]